MDEALINRVMGIIQPDQARIASNSQLLAILHGKAVRVIELVHDWQGYDTPEL